jgi:hypothetical protein
MIDFPVICGIQALAEGESVPAINMREKFVARNFEARLLRSYWQKVGGIIFSQVPVATRRLDGVRIPDSTAGEIRTFNRTEFNRLVKNAAVEVIEIKRVLNRSVIGQAVVGKALLEIGYRRTEATPVVLCPDGHDQLERACRKLRVRVWTRKRRDFVV